MKRILSKLLPPALILGVFFYFAQSYLARDLWFDEALTILNFAMLDSPLQIYRSYIIPNNQILYTILLHYWLGFDGVTNLAPDLWCRLLSLLLGAGTLLTLYELFRCRMGGGWVWLPVMAALAVSPPFLIYATAVRGYMLSALLITLALHAALRFSEHRSLKWGIIYALFSLGAVATIPTNLAALAGVVLYVLPLFGRNFLKKRDFWICALVPVAMTALFYLPILPSVIGVAKLKEGWNDGGRVLFTLVSAFIYMFAMLLIPGTGSLLVFDRRKYNYFRALRILIWFLPVPMALLLPVAPFPRVFFPFFILFALLLGAGVRDLTAFNCRFLHRWNFKVWIGALTVVVIAWGAVANRPELRLMFSRRNGGSASDDYFYGYYLRPDHTPRSTAAGLLEQFGEKPVPVFLSFASDPWPLMFYCMTGGGNFDFLFDGPRGVVNTLPRGTVIVIRSDEDPGKLEDRFRRDLKLLFVNDNHGVYFAR